MRVHPVVRDLVLVGIAVSAGWWLRDAGTAVLAQRSSYSSPRSYPSGADGGLEFQIGGVGPESSLTLYNPGNHTLYVYPRIGQGNSHISCSYSFTVATPGAPIERQNCPIADLLPQH